MKSEQRVTADILQHISANMKEMRVFRNHTGQIVDQKNQVHKFGLCNGSADFIGYQTITITSDMIGQQIAQFVSIEVKNSEGGRLSAAQKRWGDAVTRAGGWHRVVKNADELD